MVEVRRLAGNIGAELSGVRLGGDLDAATQREVRAAVLEHKVAFVRDQHHLDEDAHVAFARSLGPLTTPHPTIRSTHDGGFVLPLDAEKGGKANAWHTDVTFVDRVPAFSVLRPEVLPESGGDTAWANTVTAYESLTPGLRALVEGLWARHTNDYDYAQAETERSESDRAYGEEFRRTVYRTEHPVVRVHPETGERSIVLGQFAERIVGLSRADSDHLIDLVQAHVTRLENTVRWSWRLGDVAIWDNRATQHYAIADYGDQPRRMRRVTVAGDVPVSVAGEPSRVLEGDSSGFVADETVT
ncbi:TauD/TfdA dioxygenase family protein, partial [Solicola sp. PLA-1-18]|uniref:TauD/TfdA dioxygenase family protein n=1 Tax=Solicola sp. PLA-1-18 TaxID=3380532 RepID=UPI003B79A1AC